MNVKNWTPAETWEAVVGSQSPEEFLAISQEKAPCTMEEAASAYAEELNLMFDMDYTQEELELIKGKLLQYIEKGMATCKWCGEPFTPSTWPEHCSENCLLNDAEQTGDPERRAKLQDQQEKMEGK